MTDNLSALFAGTGSPPADDLDALFATPAAEPLPAGEYVVEIVSGRLGHSKNGKPRYELRAKIADGEHVGRTVFDDWYLTKEAWWKSAPFLARLGIKTPEQCRRDFPPGWLARVRLTVESFQGVTRNKLADIAIVRRKPDVPTLAATPPADPFAPTDATPTTEASEGDSPSTDPHSDAYEDRDDQRLPADRLTFSFGASANGPYGGERR